ncbi:MAG: AAA family ATPase [Thermoleophilaceae bacterium]
MTHLEPGFLRAVELRREEIEDPAAYPYCIPALRSLDSLSLDPHVTFLVGDNGSGKSTLLEAVAVAAGFNAEGGTQNFDFATRASHSDLHEAIRLVRGITRPSSGFFLRAESFFNVATAIEQVGVLKSYGGVPLHEVSHGESFLAVLNHRFEPGGLYLLDEPEATLSVPGNLALLRRMHDLVEGGSQFLIATHSPILMAYPDALIYELSEDGCTTVAYEDTEQYQLTRSFLEAPERFFRHLFTD